MQNRNSTQAHQHSSIPSTFCIFKHTTIHTHTNLRLTNKVQQELGILLIKDLNKWDWEIVLYSPTNSASSYCVFEMTFSFCFKQILKESVY